MLPVLIEENDPPQVILFGSMARGRVEEWSDLDLLIVKETDEPFLERSVRVALLCRAPVGVDYLVYTPAELAQMIMRGNPFILDALQELSLIHIYYTLRLDSAIAVEALDPISRGFTVERRYYDAACDPAAETCEPIDTIAAGGRVRVELTLSLIHI